uniref:Uncharacterized protein n=1 Tax=Zea mays TaxID=4577 RepID=A0A804QUJ0_MAIZE
MRDVRPSLSSILDCSRLSPPCSHRPTRRTTCQTLATGSAAAATTSGVCSLPSDSRQRQTLRLGDGHTGEEVIPTCHGRGGGEGVRLTGDWTRPPIPPAVADVSVQEAGTQAQTTVQIDEEPVQGQRQTRCLPPLACSWPSSVCHQHKTLGSPNFTALIQDIILWPVDWPTNFIYGQKSRVYIILMAYLEMDCHVSQFSPSYYNLPFTLSSSPPYLQAICRVRGWAGPSNADAQQTECTGDDGNGSSKAKNDQAAGHCLNLVASDDMMRDESTCKIGWHCGSN